MSSNPRPGPRRIRKYNTPKIDPTINKWRDVFMKLLYEAIRAIIKTIIIVDTKSILLVNSLPPICKIIPMKKGLTPKIINSILLESFVFVCSSNVKLSEIPKFNILFKILMACEFKINSINM
ncbi:hypothetical protein BTO06_02210 [Tenacibaculum sp. SZ-18]|nr:hypothetical protein BTO06_02210 [Tenacibaculum sp. SZ-18]